MRTYLFACILFFQAATASGQAEVTFQADLGPLIEAGYFFPDSGDQVIIRGSFNSWEGDVHELHAGDNSTLYSGRFRLNQSPSDTLSYKFVIIRDHERYFWEHRPEPENEPYGNRRLVLTDTVQVIPPDEFRYNEYIHFPVIFSKEKLQEDYLQFRTILEETHPALYDYTEKADLDALFDRNFARINGPMAFRDFLLLMTEVISKVGCGHSSMWIPDTYWNVAPPKLFPLQIHLTSHGNAYMAGSFLDSCSIPTGSELIGINGLAMHAIIDSLKSLQSADGFNPSYRLAKAGQHFSVKYALAFGFADSFDVEYMEPGALTGKHFTIRPVDKFMVERTRPEHNRLSFGIIGDSQTGLLTVNTFGYYGEVDKFRCFLDSTFRVIAEQGINDLILDLRGNGGGDPFCASYLWAYLQPESLPYFEDHYGRYDTLANPVPLPKNRYNGRLFTLIDGNGFSTTGHFCGLLKYHNVGKFIGTELGATYTCTGNATYPALNNTGIMVGTARVMRYTAAVKNMDPMRGVIPDYHVELSQGDIVESRDPQLGLALEIASEGKE